MGNPIGKEEFLQRAQARFADRYDYSQIVYKSYKTPIKIRCREHPVKEITITPEKHLQTTGGCKFCLRQMRISMLERELGRDSAQHPPLPTPAAQGRVDPSQQQCPHGEVREPVPFRATAGGLRS